MTSVKLRYVTFRIKLLDNVTVIVNIAENLSRDKLHQNEMHMVVCANLYHNPEDYK
jgi:hypothetical protein